MTEIQTVYLGLGSNMGDALVNVKEAINQIDKRLGEIEEQSFFYESEPWGFEAEQNFVNAVVSVKIAADAEDILRKIQAIESEMGRKRSDAPGYQSRIIDIDILAIGDQIMKSQTIRIPHPRLNLRGFVLLPMLDVAPDWVHPVINQGVEEMIERLNEKNPPKRILA